MRTIKNESERQTAVLVVICSLNRNIDINVNTIIPKANPINLLGQIWPPKPSTYILTATIYR